MKTSFLKSLFISICMVVLLFPTYALSVSTSNSVVSLGINQQGSNGGAIDSLKVLGVETVDVQDLGRLIQASVFIDKPELDLNNRTMCNGLLAPEWFNPTEGGDICGVRSIVQATSTPNPGEINVITKVQSWHGEHLWDVNDPNSSFLPDHFIIEGHHKLGPLPYTNAPGAIRLLYILKLGVGAPTPSVTFRDIKNSNNQVSPASFVPAIYFKDNVLTRAFGLSMNGNTWTEITVPQAANDAMYLPKLVKYRTVAWMRQDLGWGVGLYGRSTLGQSKNFALQRFPTGNTNMINLLNQGLGQLFRGQSKNVTAHMAVGNLTTIKNTINQIYNSGN